jgi:hypothetical protein
MTKYRILSSYVRLIILYFNRTRNVYPINLLRKLIQSQSTPANCATNTVRNSANGIPDGRFLTKTPLVRRKSRIPLTSIETNFGFDGVNFGSVGFGGGRVESSDWIKMNRLRENRKLEHLKLPERKLCRRF